MVREMGEKIPLRLNAREERWRLRQQRREIELLLDIADGWLSPRAEDERIKLARINAALARLIGQTWVKLRDQQSC